MPPVTFPAVGLVQQIIDDAKLKELLKNLCEFETDSTSFLPNDIPGFLQILSTCQEWKFEELVDLNEWIKPLDKIDAILSKILLENPSLLLVAPLKRQQSPESSSGNDMQDKKKHAESLENISDVSDATVSSLKTMLTFLSALLRNSCNKNVFNSVDELVDLLACFDDGVSDLALQALMALATPPAVHKLQQTADLHHHQTNLHKSINPHVHARILALARGWGSRANGVGLYNCVTTDDSEYGQGALLKECGEVNFEYYDYDKGLVRLHLSMKDMMMMQEDDSSSMEDVGKPEQNKQKRRRMGSMNTGGGRGTQQKVMKSTAELFFQCLEQAGGRSNIASQDQQFNLLAEVRLAAAFHSRETRIRGVERRLEALIANLYTHSNQDIMSGYFQAQPELCAELTDLLRPTVSSAAVSAASAVSAKDSDEGGLPAMSSLANSPQVPYNVRTLALETLSALVQRRDSGSSGGLAGVARLSNVLIELGVGKGMYLGILPTLIRYSLASLGAFLTSDDSNKSEAPVVEVQDPAEKIGMDLGRAFVKAAKAPLPPVSEQLHCALAFIDSVLSLTSAVISTPSGTAALTECGLVPALLSTVSIDVSSLEKSLEKLALSSEDVNQARGMLRVITSQAVQIIESSVVTHNNALSSLLELSGADVLISRLHDTIEDIRRSNGLQDTAGEDAMEVESTDVVSADNKDAGESAMECDPAEAAIGGKVDNVESEAATTARQLTSSQRILLFCLVNGLNNILNQEAGSTTAPTSSVGARLKKPELTGALIEILRNVGSYGGALASSASTLMCDVMNNEPQVVHYVHESGLAKAFFHMVMGSSRALDVDVLKPSFPASQEIIIAISNNLSALALTEAGAKAVAEVNPFPAFLSLLYSPEFALPLSRCLLNEMAAIIGTGLDEIMRNVPDLKPIVTVAIVKAVSHIADIGEKLQRRETENDGLLRAEPASALENDRSALIQYILNITEMLEQLVGNEDLCEPFVNAGGLDAVLRLFPPTTPATPSFLAHVSCLSCQSTFTLASSNTEDSILAVIKSIALHCDTAKLLKKATAELDTALVEIKQVQAQLRENFPGDSTSGSPSDEMSADGVLEGLPRAPLHALVDDNNFMPKALVLSNYFRRVTILQWYTNILTSAIRGGLARSQGSGTDWGRNEREWKNELSSDSFRKLLDQLSLFHQTALLESCRIRTEDGFEERERARQSDHVPAGSVRYRLRIVCPEGAVVRDGIDIDSCLSVGSAEFGDIVEAIDRCHNSSGVLRYRTRAGWISELTRGHGRETIAEVLNVWPGEPEEDLEKSTSPKSNSKRKESGVSDLCATGASIFARLQSSYGDLSSALSRVVTQGMRALPTRRLVFDEGSVGLHISSLTSILSSNLLRGVAMEPIQKAWAGTNVDGASLRPSGAAMYLSILLTIVQSCLVDDKRDRAGVNVLLLIALMEADPLVDRVVPHDASEASMDFNQFKSIFGAVQFVFRQCLLDLSNSALTTPSTSDETQPPAQSVPRTVAASLPPTVAFLRKLSKVPLISSNAATIIKRFEGSDVSTLVGSKREGGVRISQPVELARALYCTISEVTLEMWSDDRFAHVPVQLAWPLSSLAGEIMSSLEQALKGASTSTSDAESRSIFNIFSRSASGRAARGQLGLDGQPESNREEFEPSEEAVSRLTEMGFTRDHAMEALEATGSNHIEIAMEYALSRPPPSPGTVERRRAEREERRRRRGEANSDASQQGASGAGGSSGEGEAAPGSSVATASSGSEAPASAGAADDSAKDDKVDTESLEDKLKARVEECSKAWIDRSPNAVFNMLVRGGPSAVPDKEGDGDMEALAIAMNTFLVEMCLKNPDEMNRIVSGLLDRVKAEIEFDESTCFVPSGREQAFSSLCHMAALMTRELSGTRKLILEKGLVGIMVGCLEHTELKKPSGDEASDKTRTWPIWVAPALLVLETMAQPIVLFEKEKPDSESPPLSEETELRNVREMHTKHAADLAETARTLFPAGPEGAEVDKEVKEDPKPVDEVDTSAKDSKEDPKPFDEVDASAKDAPSEKDTTTGALSLLSVPPFAPLIPDDLAVKCLGICTKILEGKSDDSHCSPQPGVAHATFLLLSRLVRSPNLSSTFLQTGGLDTILALPRSSRFKGTTGLVSILLRRLLEDPLTLQASMETEIRSVVTKQNEHRGNSGSDDMPSISVATFARSLSLLICRDPLVFLKAASVTVRFQNRAGDTPYLILLTSEERTTRRAYLHEKIPSHIMDKKDTTQDSWWCQPGTPQSPSKAPKAKHHRRGSPSRRGSHSKKTKQAGPESASKKSGSSETASSRVMFALMTKAISLYRLDGDDGDSVLFGNRTSFLWIGSIFDIMSDLSLAFPTCAAAIHRYRPAIPRTVFSHALSGCPPPQRNFVNLLLHQLLPQDRQNVKQDPLEQGKVENEETKSKRTLMIVKMRAAQTAARLLVSLVARSGEGRQRVLSDLVFALSGGRHGFDGATPAPSQGDDSIHKSEADALQAWGDLCIGLAAPRSTGQDYERNSYLSFEMIKAMLELGMAHALVYALRRVDLQHPKAPLVCASLLIPFEVFTRVSVTDAVQVIAQKEIEEKSKRSRAQEPIIEHDDKGEKQPAAFADDTMLEDGFRNDGTGHVDVEMDSEEEESDGDNDEEMSGDDEDEDEEESSDEDSQDDQGTIEEQSDSESEMSGVDEAAAEPMDIEEDDDDDYLYDGEAGVGGPEVAPRHGDSDLDEGWTRVESGEPGEGNLRVFDGAQAISAAFMGGGNSVSARNRGFLDVAEAMIGSLLRAGQLQPDSVAELENSLGIRVVARSAPENGGMMFGHAPPRGFQASSGSEIGTARLIRAANRGGAGVNTNSIPSIRQRNPPEISAFHGGRWNESSTEHLYGDITAGNRNYDVISPMPGDTDDDLVYPSMATQLFPGGPSASTHSRMQLTQHPLFSAVELPPVNALVTNLRSHGERAALRDLTGGVPRGELYSSYYGPSRSSTTTGMLGWTDDGLPLDEAMTRFSSAFESALSSFRPTPPQEQDTPASTTEQVGDTEGQNQRSNAAQEGEDEGPDTQLEESGPPRQEEEARAGGDRQASSDSLVAPAENAGTEDATMEEANMDNEADQPTISDGDGVASSLATGLRLSPGSETHTDNDADVTNGADQMVDGPSDTAGETQEHGAAGEEQIRAETGTDEAAGVETGQDGSNEQVRAVSEGTDLVCPPGMDLEVFNSLPVDMQQEIVAQHQSAADVAAQLDSASGLDPEVLAALPEDMRREAIEQEQRERRQREEAPADPSNAEEMDNASFLASLAPNLREEILLTADETFLNSLPPNIIAEANLLRERASTRYRQVEDPLGFGSRERNGNGQQAQDQAGGTGNSQAAARRKIRMGRVKLDCDKPEVLYLGKPGKNQLDSPVGYSTMEALFRLMYLRSPVRPQKLLQKVFQNLCAQRSYRGVALAVFVDLLNENTSQAVEALRSLQQHYSGERDWRKLMDDEFVIEGEFPPSSLIGAPPEIMDVNGAPSNFLRRRLGVSAATSIAANIPTSSRGAGDHHIPQVVASRMIESLLTLTRNVPRACIDALTAGYSSDQDNMVGTTSILESLLDLLGKPQYSKSSTNLEQLLSLIESVVAPLSNLPRLGDETPPILTQDEIEAADALGKEWLEIPRAGVSRDRLELLCSILRNENCKDAAFTKVNAIARRLCRESHNRSRILIELGGVAQILGSEASRDLRALQVRMDDAIKSHQEKVRSETSSDPNLTGTGAGSLSSSVTLSSSSSELKLLRVLQTLQSLCTDHSHEDQTKKTTGLTVVTGDLLDILRDMDLESLWSQLTDCLKKVKVLEGVASLRELEDENAAEGNNEEADDTSHEKADKKKLQNSVVGLLSRFLPMIEAFFVVNASATRDAAAEDKPDDNMEAVSPSKQDSHKEDEELSSLVNGERVVEFVNANRILLNALIRNNPGLLERGLRAMAQVSRCRVLLDFDVKRQLFKTQMRRLRQQASRRHGSLRLVIRREHVFEDAYHMLRLRNADEMRGRLHITFQREEGVDAGGLSREFFGILAKEIFNPNYALFTSTEDGCTFQPNPNSSINPDHLSYFRFVGRIVGKAVADGFLLDAHFTRSLYKHMLGLKPTHHDMEAIDPDYYKNLKMILEFNLADIGLDLTFSIEDHSFGRSQIIDLKPDGRNIHVTEETKAEYVSLICQHRMTTAISSQIKAYLDGFYEMVSKDLVAIFTPKELELLISGLPDIDVVDLKRNTDYHGYRATDKEIQWFWNIMFSLSRSEKASFLQFVTGSSKVPLAGFAELQGMRGVQKFSIHKVSGHGGALMSAHTCFNSLDLPVYKSEEEMREKLLLSISEGGGAFLFA